MLIRQGSAECLLLMYGTVESPIKNYHTPTNLWQDNVFSHVRLSDCPRGEGGMWRLLMMHWTSIDRYPPPPPKKKHWTGTPTPPWQWHLVALTGGLFKLVHFRTSPGLTSGGYWSTTVSASGHFSSYWNAFLFKNAFLPKILAVIMDIKQINTTKATFLVTNRNQRPCKNNGQLIAQAQFDCLLFWRT